MKLIPQKVINMTLSLFVLSIIFSCSKDTDLLLDSVLNEPEISLEEKDPFVEEVEEDELVVRTFTFSPTNDAYLQDKQGHDRSIIRLQEDYRTSYLMFDLSPVNGSITNAVLQFSIDSDEGDGGIAIHKGLTTEWTEENLTIDNAPGLDAHLASLNKDYKVGAPEKVALDPNSLTAEVTTLVMTHSTGNDLAFASKEHPANKGPKLIVTYMAPAGSPLINQEEGDTQEEDTTQEDTTPEEDTTQEDTTQEEDTTEEDTTPEEDQPNNNTASTDGAYFVTTSGSSSNNGQSESSAWSIEHAFATAVAGDVVYVKAGNYGNKQLIADNSGSSSNPIKFIGYTNSPGDLSSNQGSTFKYGDALDANKMPLLSGSTPNGEGQGTAIKVLEPYVHIENFQITKYKDGLVSRSHHSYNKNIIVTKMGDFNPSHSYPTATSNAFLNHTGNGIILQGDGSELHNSFVLNCGIQGITFQSGNNIRASHNSVYSNNNVNPTDYYFLIGAETTNSTFTNTKIHRVGALTHLGHGIAFKGNGTISGNTVDGFEIINTFLEVQFPKTTNNTFKNGTVLKEQNVNDGTKDAAGLRLANGSKNNYYENIVLTNCSIKFSDWNDGLPGDVNDSSDNNVFENIHVKDAFSAIAFSHFLETNHASSADNNTFRNCTFSNINFLYEVDRANTGTKLINCAIDDVSSYKIERKAGGASYQVQATYQSCTWNNVGFTPPN
ncbi:hypothetical protein [Maribacter sp. 2308TA10-17]|uniref:CBM96 family carbohydrate-binding protein n=1 Tax=Maribacter sp. 2308TA10-17 TaxID=3386276 RepID=UPI0039BCE910